MEEQKSPTQPTVKLLWNLANALSSESHTNKLLRSYYLTICKKISRRDATLSQDRFSSAVMCPKCSSIWSDSKFSLKVRRQRVHSKKAARLVEALSSNRENLTKKQKTRAKWLMKRITTNLETTCEFCQKKTTHALIKPKRDKTPQEQPPPEQVAEAPTKKRKRKKRKDKSAGLNLPAITPQASKPNPPKPKSKPKPKAKSQKSVVSQTQKQNSLLQLANLLKSRTQTDQASSKLEKLLR